MAFTIPSTLKLVQLKQLALKCGIASSGTKGCLINRLQDEILLHNASQEHKDRPVRILSIDMGIRNLAYCVLELPTSKKRKGGKKVPILQSWHRLAVSSAPSPISTLDSDLVVNREMEKESFTPATLSLIAYTLLKKRLLLQNPTHVLIERQRFRSMGSKHILEWTVRVNMFESILHGVLRALKEEGIWKGSVEAITPGRVGTFWIEDGEEIEPSPEGRKMRNTANAKLQNKGAKMDLVKRWLDKENMIQLGNSEVDGVARAYKEKWSRTSPGRRPAAKGVDGEKMGKLDDLADSLLQGMAWAQWQENKRVVFKDGAEAVLEH
ncbi:mitochondrial putative cruciform cutting endonuclease 1 [Amylocarpus encephaloides]|uniref:Mitochondrial putative cruciform cutting endonuclease 1 n=1 Tax=Amylocarpus encephaloides TaxID=45428 RepID=A0A9P8C622_9HELO|nr:mitochondrial putative cruciform cutting endonuclease 1 [Amylocarpus encephaloides]